MLRLVAVLALVWVTVGGVGSAQAQSVSHGGNEFGLGLIIGNPTGISGKYFLSREIAIDGAFGLGVIGGEHLRIHGDVLWHFGITQWPAAGLDLYVGVGPVLGSHNHNNNNNHDSLWVGARGPFGASLTFNGAPFDIFLEIAANLWLVEDVRFDLDAALGGRYWF